MKDKKLSPEEEQNINLNLFGVATPPLRWRIEVEGEHPFFVSSQEGLVSDNLLSCVRKWFVNNEMPEEKFHQGVLQFQMFSCETDFQVNVFIDEEEKIQVVLPDGTYITSWVGDVSKSIGKDNVGKQEESQMQERDVFHNQWLVWDRQAPHQGGLKRVMGLSAKDAVQEWHKAWEVQGVYHEEPKEVVVQSLYNGSKYFYVTCREVKYSISDSVLGKENTGI